MKQISLRQICLLFIAFVPVTKVIFMPALLAHHANNQLWIAALVAFLVEGGVIAALVWLARAYPGTFFDLLSDSFGKTAARAVYVLYALFFSVKSCVLVVEQRSFIEVVMYETTPTILNFLPFFFVALFVCVKGIRSLGRMADVCFWMTLNAFGLILALTVLNLNFEAFLPLFYGAFPKVLRGAQGSVMWFGECSYLLFFMGKIKWSRRPFLKTIGSYAVAAAIVLFFLIAYYGLFEETAVRNIYAVARTAKYSIALSNVGRLDFFAVFLLLGVGLVALSAPLLLATECLCDAFPIRQRFYPAAAVVLVPFLFQIFLGTYLDTALNLSQGPLAWFYVAMSYGLPPIACLLPKHKHPGGFGAESEEEGPAPAKRRPRAKKEAPGDS